MELLFDWDVGIGYGIGSELCCRCDINVQPRSIENNENILRRLPGGQCFVKIKRAPNFYGSALTC
jgi:hypothetical protein